MKHLFACTLIAAFSFVCSPAWAAWQYQSGDDYVEGRVSAGGYTLSIGCEEDWGDGFEYDTVAFDTPSQGKAGDLQRLEARDPRMTVRIDGHDLTFSAKPNWNREMLISFYADSTRELYQALAAAARSIEVSVTLSSPTEVFGTKAFPVKGSTAVVKKVFSGCEWM